MFKGETNHGMTIFDPGCHIKGEVSFRDELRIFGQVTGSVVSDGELSIGEQGLVDGEIKVRKVVIEGEVRGVLQCEQVEIHSNGKVTADIYTPSLTIQEGAFFEGRCFMRPQSERIKGADPKKVTQMPLAKKR